MAYETLISRSNRQPGIYRSGNRTVPDGLQRVSFRLNIATWTNAIDFLCFGVEHSGDGGTTWRHVGSMITHGGNLDKEGNLPSMTWNTPTAGLARMYLLLGQQTNIGLDIEVI